MQRLSLHGELHVRRENLLHLVRLNAQLGHGHGEITQIFVLAGSLLVPGSVETVREHLGQAHVKVETAEGRIPGLADNLKRTHGLVLASLLHSLGGKSTNTDVGGASTHVEKHHMGGGLERAVKTIMQGRRGVLLDQTENLEVRNVRRGVHGLALVLGEVRRHSDDAVLDRLAAVGFTHILDVLQNQRHELLGSILSVLELQRGRTSGLVGIDLVREVLRLELLHDRMVGGTSHHTVDVGERKLRLAPHQGVRIGTKHAFPAIERDTGWGLALGLEVVDNLHRCTRLNNGNLDRITGKVDTNDVRLGADEIHQHDNQDKSSNLKHTVYLKCKKVCVLAELRQ
mmetsp:Transcript_28468/g.48849  ORF Transcript_28468/g.48849 Transcript_28468/m.48849 type:complete len:342 (+) Transcript_28468:1943-2968(+)